LVNLKKLSIDIIALISIFLLIFIVPREIFPIEAKFGMLSLFLTKFILVSAAIIHAHITRKLLFPYIDFSEEKNISNNIMIIAWYVIIIFAWSRGG
jgi:quinol-cytochrome oxidoreductase complex cytochrome b subunit